MNEDFVAKQPLLWELKRQPFYLELTERFDLSEIKQLCSALDIKYEELKGENLSEKAIALFDYFERNERLKDLFQVCQEIRPQKNWWYFLEPAEHLLRRKQLLDQTLQKRRLSNPFILTLLAISFFAAGFAFSYVVNLNLQPPSNSLVSSRAGFAFGADFAPVEIVYDFEDCPDALQRWEIVNNEQADLECSTRFAFEGFRSLGIPIDIHERVDIDSPTGTTQIWLQNITLTNKLLVMRIFAPPEAPPTVAAQLLVLDANDSAYFGPIVQLRPGAWNNIVWAISSSEELDNITTLGIELKIEGRNLNLDDSQYIGEVFLDSIEIYPFAPG